VTFVDGGRVAETPQRRRMVYLSRQKRKEIYHACEYQHYKKNSDAKRTVKDLSTYFG